MDLLGDFIFAVGSLICHQQPERSFFLGGEQLPVCARCTGLYLSGAAGFLAFLTWKTARRVQLAPTGTRTGQVPPTGTCTVQVAPTGTCTIDAGVARRVFLIAAIPTAISLALGALGVWDGSNVTRALLAIPLGATAGAIVAAVITKDLR